MDATHPETRPLEELLAHARWVRRLARSLARDEHGADDVVQGVFEAGLQAPPSTTELKGWVRSVARRLQALRARGEERRRRRERAAARGERLPAASDLVARTELHRLVVEAVLELPEPQRRAVLLRYFEDEQPAAIARELGVPPATVRSWLARARERLRRRLDRSFPGGHAAWALVALRWPAPGAAGATASGSLLHTLAGALAVSTKKTVLAAAGAVLVAALVIIASRPSPTEEGPVEPLSVGASGGGAEPARPVQPQEPEIVPRPFTPPDDVKGNERAARPRARPMPPVAVVTGRVTVRGRGPLTEGRVFLWGFDEAGDELDAHGGFRIETRRDQARGLYLRAGGGGDDDVRMALGAEVRPVLGREVRCDVELLAGERLHGRVVAAAGGGPVAGAAITVRAPSTDRAVQCQSVFLKSGPDGAFAVAHVPRGRYRLEVEHPRFTPKTLRLEVASSDAQVIRLDAARDLEVVLENYASYAERFGEITLQCRRFEPAPDRPGGERLTPESVMLEGRPDADGRFVVTAPRAGAWHYDCFSYAGFPRQQGRLEVPEGHDRVRLVVTLPPPGDVRLVGRLLAGGRGAGGVRLRVGRWRAETAPDGSFAMEGVAPGRHDVRAVFFTSHLHRVEHPLGALDVPDAAEHRTELELPGDATIRLVLGGVPEEQMSKPFFVQVSREGSPPDASADCWGVGSPGKPLDIPGLAPGRHRVRIRFRELQLPEQEVLVASAGERVELRLALGVGAGLELAVRTPDGVRPPAAVHVCAPPRSGGTGGAARLRVRSCLPLDAEGRVRTRLLPAGVHDVEVWAVGFHPVVLTVTVPAEGAPPVAELTLHPR